METLLKSLIRLIKHGTLKSEDRERHYEFEINIFFDNAFESRNSAENKSEKQWAESMQRWKVFNPWVNSFIRVLKMVLDYHNMSACFDQSHLYVTPYGGRIVYSIEGVPLIIHLKDADSVQKGKRWSQGTVSNFP